MLAVWGDPFSNRGMSSVRTNQRHLRDLLHKANVAKPSVAELFAHVDLVSLEVARFLISGSNTPWTCK